MAHLLDSLFRFPSDRVMTTKQVAQILDLLDLPVGVMDRRFRTQILNRAARDFLKRVGITVGDRSKRSRYSESRAFITPVVTETFRSGRVTFAPDFDLGVPIEGGLVIAVCPGRIQTSDVAFIVAVTGSSKRDKDSVLQHIVEGFAPGVVLVGPDMKHRVFSTRARSMFRLGAVNPIGMRTSEMNPSEQAKVLEQQFAKLMQDHTGRIEEAYPVASSKLGVIRSDIIAWPVWTSDGVCEGLMLLMQPVETQATAPYPDAKAIEMLGREGYAYGPPIFYTHVDGTISVMTAAGRALVGEAASDRPASFKTGLKWAHPEVIEAMYGDLVRGSEFATVMTELHTDQGLKPMRILAHAIREVGDITSQIRLVLSDVSEFENTRKMLSETIKSLATQNEVMDKALEALDLPIAVFDSDLKVVKINTAIANRLGISPKDAEGRDIAEVIPTARRLGMADLMRQAMDQWKETHVPRYEHVTRDGHEVPIEGVLFPLRIEGRRCCLAVSREMADVAKLEKESARWASLCRALMGATRDGVVVLDRDGVAVQVNEVIARRFKDKSRLVGRTSADFFMVKERELLCDLLKRASEGREAVHTGRIKFVRTDSGEEVFVELDLIPLEDPKGRPDGVAIVVHFPAGPVKLEDGAKRYTDNLERLVTERTAEISSTNNRLAETVDRITSIAEAGMLLGSLKDPNAVFGVFLDQARQVLDAGFVSLAAVEKRGGVPCTTYHSVGTAPASDVMTAPEIEAGMARLVLGRGTADRVRTAGPGLLLADVDLGGAKGLMVVSKPEGEFGRIEIGLAGLLCNQIGFAFPISRYLADLKTARDRAECLRRIAVEVAGASSPVDAVKQVAREIGSVLPIARMFWIVEGSDGRVWVSEVYNRTGRCFDGPVKLSPHAELKRQRDAVENGRGTYFCEIPDASGSADAGAKAGPASERTCPFRLRPEGSLVGPSVAAMLRDGGIVPQDGGEIVTAPVMISDRSSWGLLSALLDDQACLAENDACFICTAASTLACVWKAADCASVVRRLWASSETVCGLVHDLKYPMNKMWSDLDVLEKTCSSGLRAEDLEAIRGSLSGLRALADELGEVANPASRRPEVIHVDELIEHCLSLLSAELAAKAVKVTKDIPAVPPIYADRRDAVRIVLNILGNGVEAVAANGAIRIGAARTDPRPDGSSVSITFENSGPGVPEGDVHRVFDPFFTTKRGGTGLGLFSARKRAQANGGDVACEFVCGGGSRFVATFPAAVG